MTELLFTALLGVMFLAGMHMVRLWYEPPKKKPKFTPPKEENVMPAYTRTDFVNLKKHARVHPKDSNTKVNRSNH